MELPPLICLSDKLTQLRFGYADKNIHPFTESPSINLTLAKPSREMSVCLDFNLLLQKIEKYSIKGLLVQNCIEHKDRYIQVSRQYLSNGNAAPFEVMDIKIYHSYLMMSSVIDLIHFSRQIADLQKFFGTPNHFVDLAVA